ncbi:MAG: hypothetical protein J6N53_16275 [Lachnospiraceae bacterium]|nr:hypothetical protein [Lachnospiraceae bacterium]
MARKTLEEMSLIDNFLMQAVSSDQEVSEPSLRCILSVLLQRKIGQISVNAEKMIPGYSPDHRGIRMDVEVIEKGEASSVIANVYDVEPHTANDTHFPKANRFRQAKIDSRYMESGDNEFEHLPDLYVITITNFDIFGEDQMIYTFRERCEEIPGLTYEDGLCFIYFNTTGKKGGSQSIKNMLHFIENSDETAAVDTETQELEQYIRKVKLDPEVRRELMTFGDYIDRERREEKIEDILDLLGDYGEIPEELIDRINTQHDKESLRILHKLAARVDSIEDFELQMDEVLKNTMAPA